jgi:acetyl esterase/lipase
MHVMRTFFIIIAIIALIGGATYFWFTSHPPAQQLNKADAWFGDSSKGKKIDDAVVFDATHDVALNVWRPSDLDDSAKAPVLVFIYGGSWRTGDRDEYDFVARTFTDLGYIVVLPNYRLFPQVKFPAMVEDSAAALAWTHDNIAKYGGDPSQIVLSGHSAGAYNAVMAVLGPQWLAKYGKTDDIVRAIAPLAGPFDFYPFDSDSTQDSFGDAPDPKATQPVNFARGDAPPMLLLTGDNDKTVQPRNSQELQKRIIQAGGQAAYKEYAGLGHADIIMAASSLFSSKAPVIDDMDSFFKEVLARPINIQAPNDSDDNDTGENAD